MKADKIDISMLYYNFGKQRKKTSILDDWIKKILMSRTGSDQVLMPDPDLTKF